MSCSYFIGIGVLNFVGTTIYTFRVPERWYPRTFDVYGSSHQFLHGFVVLGAASHAVGLVKAFEYWNGEMNKGGFCLSPAQ